MTLTLALNRVFFATVTETHRTRSCGTSGIRLRGLPAIAYHFAWMPGMTLKRLLPILLLATSCNAMAAWVEYSTMANGDVHFFDNERVQKDGNLVRAWNRVRYKTSVMGASSYQSLLKIDCAERSETTLQSTFYTDKNWATPAMATDAMAKPKVSITANSATQRLADILCN